MNSHRYSIAVQNRGALQELALLFVIVVICLTGFTASTLLNPDQAATAEATFSRALHSNLVVVARTASDGTVTSLSTPFEISEFERTANLLKASLGGQPGQYCVYGYLVQLAGAGCTAPIFPFQAITDQDMLFCPDISSIVTCETRATALHDGNCLVRPMVGVYDTFTGSCDVAPATTIRG